MRLSGPELVELSRLLRVIEDLDGDAREAALAAEVSMCGGDLVSLARTLLNERDLAAPLTLPKLADLDVGPGAAAAVAALVIGQRIGNYQLQRELGRGGMSSVWLAQRTDALTHRPIALKLPFAHLQPAAALAERLSRERDILASLTHPNIARLYDAGVTPEGQPFLVLEFIDGVRIDDYCRAERLPIQERIDLAVQVLDAVGYAHSRQIIHRDLKPCNILVRENGQVALLDFGIAKLLVDGATVETELTQHGGRALTLDYASPEQIAGEPLGVASDVYSMGIVLYELLTGTRPYELRSGSRGALEDAILAAEVRLPEAAAITADLAGERATTTRALRRQLSADLGAVLMKALRRNPADRYPTAGDFSDDLRRYRRGDAVRARHYPWAARLRRFIVRRRVTLAGVGLAAALVVVATQLWLVSHRTQRTAVTAPVATEQSVAVLPFTDLSTTHDQGDFADGLADELIGILSTVPGLHTAAHSSTLALKNGQTDLRAIGAKLNVAHVLVGSVRKVGDRIQVAVTLRRVTDERVLWSGRYDRSETDISRIQQDISAEVASALKITLLNTGMSQHSGTANPSAYTLYLQARSIFSRGGSDNARRATEYLRESLSLDPKFAAAWATLSRIEHLQALEGWVRGNEIRTAASDAARRAIALDPLLADAHIALGESRFDFDWDWRVAEAEFDRALELDRGNAEALRSAADVALTLGKFSRARDFAQRAILLDPLVALNYSHLARIELQVGELRAAQVAFRKALDLDPAESLHASLGIALLLDGQSAAALAEIEREHDEEWREVNLPFAYYALRRARAAEGALARAKAKWADDAAFQIAEYYAYTGAKRESLAWLARAVRQRDDGLVWIKGDPFLRTLNGDDEYRRLLDALHVPP